MSVRFVPAGWSLDTEFQNEREGTHLVIDEHFFRNAEGDGLEYNRENLYHVAGVPSPVGISIVHTLRQLVATDSISEWPLLVDYLATGIAARAIKYFGDQYAGTKEPYPKGLPHDRVRRVIDFIEANVDRPLHLKELSDVAALSAYHFAQAFRRTVGVSPVRYVWHRRVERAKKLLLNRDVPIALIAFDCGFSSQSHFSTVFKRETGMTPAAYRRKALF